MTNEELKQKCLQYERINGGSVEFGNPGKSLYEFIVFGKEIFTKEAFENWEKDLENLKDISL